MWSPTHVQVTVQRAKGLLIKGKNNTNDCFVTIELDKEKFQTSVKHKSTDNCEWKEECDLRLPDKANNAAVLLTVLHRNLLGDQFLGQVSLPLNNFDVYERPRSRWYPLMSKPNKQDKDTKQRGEIEVRVGFTVKEGSNDSFKKEKHKSSMGQLSSAAQSLGGSLLSIGSHGKRKGIKKFAKNLGSKLNISNKKDKKEDSDSIEGSIGSFERQNSSANKLSEGQQAGEADPGVISEDEDEFAFDDLSHKSSGSSLHFQGGGTLPRASKFVPSPMNASLENLGGGELLRRSTSGGISQQDKVPPTKPVRLGLEGASSTSILAEEPQQQQPTDEWSQKLFAAKAKTRVNVDREPKEQNSDRGKGISTSSESVPTTLSKDDNSPKRNKKFGPKEKVKKLFGERIIIGEEGIVDEIKMNPAYSKLPRDVIKQYENKSREELVVQAWSLQNEVESQKKKVRDLENYLDELLLRVMETTPRILQNPYSTKSLCIKQK